MFRGVGIHKLAFLFLTLLLPQAERRRLRAERRAARAQKRFFARAACGFERVPTRDVEDAAADDSAQDDADSDATRSEGEDENPEDAELLGPNIEEELSGSNEEEDKLPDNLDSDKAI